MTIRIEKVEGGYLARFHDPASGQYDLIDSEPRDSESISKMLHERGYDQRDIHQAFVDADPDSFRVGKW